MPSRRHLEIAATVAAACVCAAFVLSFVLGLRGGADPSVDLPSDSVAIEEPAPNAGRLEVLNASGRGGLARAATDRLRSGGFDVVYFGNAPASAGDSSAVIDRMGNDAVARAAARHLGIERVRSAQDTTLFLDATVIIGKDWPPLSERRENDEETWGARLKRWLSPKS